MRWTFNQEQQDRRAALTPTILANIHRKPSTRAFSLADFMPQRHASQADGANGGADAARRQTPEEQLAIMAMITQAAGGTVNLPGLIEEPRSSE